MGTIEQLETRIEALEARVAQLESAPRRSPASGAGRASGAAAGIDVQAASWTRPYEMAELEVQETWIELHEHSARPQLQRLIRTVVEVEGPVTDRLALDRVRRAWGLKRAGGRVQEAFDQAVRQLVARALVERRGDALMQPGAALEHVRVPTGDEATRRGADDVPLIELQAAFERIAGSGGGRGLAEDDLAVAVSRIFGWTRRGGAIQERLTAALDAAVAAGSLERRDGLIRAHA